MHAAKFYFKNTFIKKKQYDRNKKRLIKFMWFERMFQGKMGLSNWF